MSPFLATRRRLDEPAAIPTDAVPVTVRAIRSLLAQGDDPSLSVQDMADGLTALDVSTRETMDATQSIDVTTSRLADQASTVATAAEQMSAAMSEVARAASRTTTAVLEASGPARSVRGAATELAEAAGKIDEVVQTVSRISDQTRLLALNANDRGGPRRLRWEGLRGGRRGIHDPGR